MPPAPHPRRRRWLLALLASGLALGAAEGIARVTLAIFDRMPTSRPADGTRVELFDMVKPATHPDIIYELQPGLDCSYQGVPVQTNSVGWRGAEVAVDKATNGFRVLALGDSVIFGWGVAWPDSIVPQLEQRLRALLQPCAVDVIGTGVPGYNTAMEAVVLREKGLRYAPDVVLVDYVGNDFELPNFLLAQTDFLRLDHCYLLDLARRAWHSTWTAPQTRLQWAPMANAGRYESDPERVPPQYRHLVGATAYRAALQSITALGRTHGFRVLVTTHHALSTEAAAICAECGVPVQDMVAPIAAWLHAQGHADYHGSPLTLSRADPHPSARLHAMWAEVVASKLQELGWLPR